MLARILAGALLAALAYIAAGGLMSALSQPARFRGEMVDIGGRRLRLVCAGPADGSPVVLMEAGAFGFSADWAAVQSRLANKGVRSCAYDRAGLGRSDPGPGPRDGLAVVRDLEALLQAKGIKGPYILVGHSMGGLRVRLFAGRHRQDVAGLVLVDAATPESTARGPMRGFVKTFANLSRLAGWGASAGLFKPLSFMGDRIGLLGEASREKRWAFARGPHNSWAADEVDNWMVVTDQALAAGPPDPAWPLAVVTAGPDGGEWKQSQAAPARAAWHGHYRNVPDASHASVLGEAHADAVVEAIEFIRRAGAQKAGGP